MNNEEIKKTEELKDEQLQKSQELSETELKEVAGGQLETAMDRISENW